MQSSQRWMLAFRRMYKRTRMLRRTRPRENPVKMAIMPVWFVGVTEVSGGRMAVVEMDVGVEVGDMVERVM